MSRLALLLALGATALAPAAADARTKRVFWQVDAAVSFRVWDHIGFTPINGIQGEGEVTRYRAGTTTYVVSWINATASIGTKMGLRVWAKLPHKTMFTDRALRAKEKRRGWRVAWDMARDADVLLVHRDNPVCASGLTRAQARGIARGEITNWSQLGGSGAIKRYLVGDPAKTKADTFAEPRFGAKGSGHPVDAVRFDGGVSEAASDPAAAAITSWSRVRHGSGACAVAIDGVAPTNASVHALQYGPAHPVQFVWNTRRPKHKAARVMYREYRRFLKSEKAREDWRGRGLLLADEPVPAEGTGPGAGPPPASGPPPAHDHAGRPISAARDDSAATAELEGERFESGSVRFAFDPGGTLTRRTQLDAETCGQVTGGWTVLEGWRYGEHGGGIIAVVRLFLEEQTDVTIELPNETPGTAYIDGQPYTRDPGLPAGCG